MSGNFYVTSGNRLAVRKLLVSSGLPASDVRMWPVSKLGATLRERVHSGLIQNDAAVAACRAITPDQDIEFIPQPIDGPQPIPLQVPAPINNGPMPILQAPNGDTAGNALAAAIGIAVQNALATLPKGTDEEAVRAIAGKLDKGLLDKVDGMIQARLSPHVIEIKTGDAVKKIEGRVHTRFGDVVKIVTTRVAGRRLHAWLVGPSGSGKSHLAAQVAEACGLDFYSTGAIQSKYDLIGFVSPTGNETTLRTPFRNAFEYGGLFSWDDCDASDPRAFVSFNEALSNGRFAFPDKCVVQHPDFVAVASANTWGNGATAEYVGRNKIDAATLSRFVRIEIGYDEAMERDLVSAEHASWVDFVQRIRKAVATCGVKVLVTPRATLQGAALLTTGMTRAMVEAATVFAGVDRETEAKLRKAA